MSTMTMASHGQPSRKQPSGPLLRHFLQPIQRIGSIWMRPNGGLSSSGTQNMQSSTGQYSTQAGDPAQPVQHSVMTASSLGFFLRAVTIPLERGSCFISSGTIPGAFATCGSVAIAKLYLRSQDFVTVAPFARLPEKDAKQPAKPGFSAGFHVCINFLFMPSLHLRAEFPEKFAQPWLLLFRASPAIPELLRETQPRQCLQSAPDRSRVAAAPFAVMICRLPDSRAASGEKLQPPESQPAKKLSPALAIPATRFPNVHAPQRTPRYGSIAVLRRALRRSNLISSAFLVVSSASIISDEANFRIFSCGPDDLTVPDLTVRIHCKIADAQPSSFGIEPKMPRLDDVE